MQAKLLDSRDIRGKRHELAFVVVLFLIAILRTDKKLTVSVIHRSMVEDCGRLAAELGIKVDKCVSYSQLKRILKIIDYQQFNSINVSYFGSVVHSEADQWFSLDGKELRGTIDRVSGEKRGLSIVNLTSHQSGQSQLIGHYDGSKASEKPVVCTYFKQAHLSPYKYSFDALHTSRENLATIASKKGVYLAALKANQKSILAECEWIDKQLKASWQQTDYQKGHGRVEKRHYKGYDFVAAEFDQRWKQTQTLSLIVVERERFIVKTKKTTQETSYWISNQVLDNDSFDEMCQAIRNHWCIEVHHHQRDVQLGEDQLRIKDHNQALTVASFITLASNLVEKQGGNKSILREKLTKNWNLILPIFNAI